MAAPQRMKILKVSCLRLLNEEQEQIIMRHLKESGCKACKETMDVSLDMADLFFQYKRKLFELFDEVQFGGIRLKEGRSLLSESTET